jgi:hypothetical protein
VLVRVRVRGWVSPWLASIKRESVCLFRSPKLNVNMQHAHTR